MSTLAIRPVSAGQVVGMIVGLCISLITGFVSYSAFTAEEPAPVSLTIWLTEQATLTPRTSEFVAQTRQQYDYQPILRVSLAEFKKQAAGKPYIASIQAGWFKGTPAGSNHDAWQVVYAVRDTKTNILVTAFEAVPWNNNFGWHTDTYYDRESKMFVERATMRSPWLAVLMIVFVFVGFGIMAFAYFDP